MSTQTLRQDSQNNVIPFPVIPRRSVSVPDGLYGVTTAMLKRLRARTAKGFELIEKHAEGSYDDCDRLWIEHHTDGSGIYIEFQPVPFDNELWSCYVFQVDDPEYHTPVWFTIESAEMVARQTADHVASVMARVGLRHD